LPNFSILRKPIVTEKSSLLQEQSKYVFEVSMTANKAQVKGAVQDAFGVNVIGVNIIKVHGKRKRYGPRQVKSRKYKKAIVTLIQGDKIELFEGA